MKSTSASSGLCELAFLSISNMGDENLNFRVVSKYRYLHGSKKITAPNKFISTNVQDAMFRSIGDLNSSSIHEMAAYLWHTLFYAEVENNNITFAKHAKLFPKCINMS